MNKKKMRKRIRKLERRVVALEHNLGMHRHEGSLVPDAFAAELLERYTQPDPYRNLFGPRDA